MRIAGLSADSSWSHLIWPVDPRTGDRHRALVRVVEDPDQIERAFVRWAG